MKHLTYLALSSAVLLLLFLCMPITIMGFPSHAQTKNNIATLADSVPIEITEIEVDRFKVNRIQLLMQGNSCASLDLPQLDGTINFYRKGAAFAEKDVQYSINYDTKGFDDTYGNHTGLVFLKASIVLKDERYVMAPEVSTEISIPIFLYDPDQPSYLPPLNSNLNKYDAMKTFHIVTDIHTDLQHIEMMLHKDFPYQSFYIYFENGYYLNLPNAWDLNSVKTNDPGIYQAYRRPELPQGVLMKNIPEEVYNINIQDSKIFTLSSPISFGNNIVITWLYSTSEPSLFRLRYRIGKGDWILDNDEYFMRLHSDKSGRLSLFLNPWEMKKDIHYQFQLEYDGVYSDILNLCVNKDGFYIPNEGDEDGGDRNNQNPPDVIQPPQNPSKSDNRSADDSTAAISDQTAENERRSSPKSSVSSEADTSTATTWSGSRIRQYLKASPGLPLIVEKDLIRVAIPADSLALLALSDTDFLHVEIQTLSADTLRLTARLNEVPLTGIPMIITMPWAEDDDSEDLQVKKAASEWIGKVDKSNPEGSITFTITQSGVYTILPSVSKESESTTEKKIKKDALLALESEVSSNQLNANVQSVMGIRAILILGSISVVAFLYYKRKKG